MWFLDQDSKLVDIASSDSIYGGHSIKFVIKATTRLLYFTYFVLMYFYLERLQTSELPHI